MAAIPVQTPGGIEPAFELTAYYPVLIYAVVVVVFALGTIAATHLFPFKPRKPTRVKEMPYESGMDPIGVGPACSSTSSSISLPSCSSSSTWNCSSSIPGRWSPIGEGGDQVWRTAFGTVVFLRDPGLHRHGCDRLRLRLAEGGVPVALTRLLPDFVVTKLDCAGELGPQAQPVADALRDGLLRHRADGDRRSSRYDIARFGAEVMRFSPRQCDLMIVAGRVVMKMVPVLQRIWLQMPEPKWCISMGACASSGGVFDTYAVVQGIDRFIPVDVYVPGCPPRPEQLIRAVLDLQEKIQQTGTHRRPRVRRAHRVRGPDRTGQGTGPRTDDRRARRLPRPRRGCAVPLN